jgi:hypothetical protein
MEKLLNFAGNVAAVVGIAFCLFAGIVRLAGTWQIIGFELGTLFLVGIAFMAVGILVKLQHLSRLLRK